MESGRDRNDGVTAVPRIISVLCSEWETELSVVSAERGSVPGRAIQHRVLCASNDDGGAGMQSYARRLCTYVGDLHLYLNHTEQAREQLTRECRPLPRMKLNPSVKSIHEFRFEDFELV